MLANKIKEIQDFGGAVAWLKEIPLCKKCGNSMTFKNKTDYEVVSNLYTASLTNPHNLVDYFSNFECPYYDVHVEMGLMKIEYPNDNSMLGYYIDVNTE